MKVLQDAHMFLRTWEEGDRKRERERDIKTEIRIGFLRAIADDRGLT